MTSVFVAPIGPPCVINQIRSNRRNDQIVMNNASNMTDGCIVGQTTARKTLRRSAPSMTAASRNSSDTPCSAASRTTDAKGKICQIVAISTAGSASVGSSSQFSAPAAKPRKRNARFQIPYCALYIQVKMSATATGGAAQGMVTIARATPRPRKGPLSSNAASKPSPIDSTTQAIV